jgi:hypothetical protein
VIQAVPAVDDAPAADQGRCSPGIQLRELRPVGQHEYEVGAGKCLLDVGGVPQGGRHRPGVVVGLRVVHADRRTLGVELVRHVERGVPNPARAELHLLHPERHDKAAEAEQVLRQAQVLLERAAGGPVIGTVSVRNDPMDAIEETIFTEPVDEIILSVAPHGLSTMLHQDLAHRLGHFGLPITVVAPEAATT